MESENQIRSTETKLTEIGKIEKTLLGEPITYSFFIREGEGKRQYAVSVAGGGERESCFLGTDLFPAITFFQKIVEGDVFPYTLSELVEDFWQESKKIEEESA